LNGPKAETALFWFVDIAIVDNFIVVADTVNSF
jgi:hypothetical protein